MEKNLVLCRSKYGSAQRYADMLREEYSCDVEDAKNCKRIDFSSYDTVILVGGVYAGAIAGMKNLKNSFHALTGKRVAVFCVGASPYDPENIEHLKKNNLTGPLADIPIFYGRGAWDESRMSFSDRAMCWIFKKLAVHLNDTSCEPWLKELVMSPDKKYDWVERKNLMPLLNFLHETKP